MNWVFTETSVSKENYAEYSHKTFKENSREVSPVEGLIVDIMRGKYGDGSISCLQIWMKDVGFPVRGFFLEQNKGPGR